MKIKQKFKLLIYILISILLISIVSAQTDWDYISDESYRNQDFIRNSDATKWALSKVDFSNTLIYQNPSLYKRKDIYTKDIVYSYKEFYDNLPLEEYKNLDYKLVKYDLIPNHSKIDSTKYFSDLGCKLCYTNTDYQNTDYKKIDYSVRENNLLTFSNRGIKHKNGDYISIPGSYPPRTFFKVDESGITAYLEGSSPNSIEIPEGDSLAVNMGPFAGQRKIEYGNVNFKFDYGDVKFINGEIFVPTNYEKIIRSTGNARINGVDIQPKLQDVKLFFDGKDHQDCTCAYISMDENKKILVTGTNKISEHSINLPITNPFIKIQAPLEIVNNFGTIILQNRNNKGLIPSIVMKVDTNTKVEGVNTINNGATSINVDENLKITQ